MQYIVICIPTYKRPEMLQKTLNSLCETDIEGTVINKVDIIVVDNDAEHTAESTVKSFSNIEQEGFQVHYFNYAKKGLANVRNELLERAITSDPNFIVFIDDDEFASPKWLEELVKTAIENDADIAMGPVASVFEKPVPVYISRWFKQAESMKGKSIDTIASNNLIINTQFLRRSGLRFDPRFNTTGAEDTFFGIQAKRAGAKICWAEKALVYETVFESRAKLDWLFKRRYRGAITYTYIMILEKQYGKILKKTVVSAGYIVAGTVGLLLLPFDNKNKYWGILKIAEGVGGFSGLLNLHYHEYK